MFRQLSPFIITNSIASWKRPYSWESLHSESLESVQAGTNSGFESVLEMYSLAQAY